MAGRRLCFFKASLTTPRYVLALRGREGWESQVRLEEKEKADVVGNTKGKGIFSDQTLEFKREIWRIKANSKKKGGRGKKRGKKRGKRKVSGFIST